MYPTGTGPNLPDVTEDKLLPPNEGAITPPELGNEALPINFQPIPIHVVPQSVDRWILPISQVDNSFIIMFRLYAQISPNHKRIICKLTYIRKLIKRYNPSEKN